LTEFTPEYSFPVLRFLFLFARPQEGSNIYREFALSGTIPLMFSLMRAWMTIENCGENQMVILALKEALQVIFSCTLDMGTLARGEQMSYEQCIPSAKEEMKTLISVICLNSTTYKEQLNELKMSCMNCCINIPISVVPVLLEIGDKDLILKNLFDLLDDEMATVDESKKHFLPLFILLKNLFALVPDIRPYGMKRMFPDRDLAIERSKEEKLCMDVPESSVQTTGNKIVKLMTSFQQAIQFTANDLLFALVGEDPDLLISLTGFGNAAGLLAMRNMFGMGANLKGPDTLEQFQQAAAKQQENVANVTEEEKEAFLRSINATDPSESQEGREQIQAQHRGPSLAELPNLIPEREGETEEDKEDRMVRNFETLVDAGFIKVLKKEGS